MNYSYLNNASEEEQIKAVRGDWQVIKYIQDPSPKVQEAAIKQEPVGGTTSVTVSATSVCAEVAQTIGEKR
jgi:hypothetical protein